MGVDALSTRFSSTLSPPSLATPRMGAARAPPPSSFGGTSATPSGPRLSGPNGLDSLRTQVERIAAQMGEMGEDEREEEGADRSDGELSFRALPVPSFDGNATSPASSFRTPQGAGPAAPVSTAAPGHPLTAARLDLLRSIDAKLAAKRAAREATPDAVHARAPRVGPPTLARWGVGEA